MKEKKIIRILTASIILIVAGLLFFIYKNNESEKIRVQQEIELNNVYLELDSVSGALGEKILTISQLGGNIDSLIILKESIEEEKKAFILSFFPSVLRSYHPLGR